MLPAVPQWLARVDDSVRRECRKSVTTVRAVLSTGAGHGLSDEGYFLKDDRRRESGRDPVRVLICAREGVMT